MTESDYLACEDPLKLLNLFTWPWGTPDNATGLLSVETSPRKLRLFSVACWYALRPKILAHAEKLNATEHFELAENAVDMSEMYADGRTNKRNLDACSQQTSGSRAIPWMLAASSVCWHDCNINKESCAVLEFLRFDPTCGPLIAAALREVMGNPFHTVRLDQSWLTPEVIAMANAAYRDRCKDGTLNLADLAELSDALEEAGCPLEEESLCPTCGAHHADPENPFGVKPGYHPECDPASGRYEGGWTNCKTCNSRGERRPGFVSRPHPLLAHLRGPGLHVRGCWALDLLLGKE